MDRLLIYSVIDLHSNRVIESESKSSSVLLIVSNGSPTSVRETQFRILLWTKYFGGNQWTRLRLDRMNCSFSNCLLTDDRRDLVNSDALLFHWRDINVEDLPKSHFRGQKWVLYNWESPHYTPVETIKPLVNDIDWTMTYRRDSDVFVPYGRVKHCDNRWQNEHLFHKKTKSIAWIVSNCLTQSNRELFVKELSKYIDIDIYGYCGQYECRRDESCLQMIANNYKFYLSFENSLCKDYVTEKLFRTLEYDIIPIVYGSADYNKILPKNSFINIMDFSSAKQLSNYLKLVSSDKQKYNSYLKWKTSHCVQQTEYRYFCELCEKLNQNLLKSHINESKVRVETNNRDLIEWWFQGSHCQTRNISNSLNVSLNILQLAIIIVFIKLYIRFDSFLWFDR